MSTKASLSQLLSERRKKYVRVAAMGAGAGVALTGGFQGASSVASGATATWVGPTTGSALFFDPANWDTGVVPNAVSDIANFTTSSTVATTINVTSSITLGALNLITNTTPPAYRIDGGPASNGVTLTMDNGASNATIALRLQPNTLMGASHSVNLSILLNSNTTIAGQNNHTYLIGGGVNDAYTFNLNGKNLGITPIFNNCFIRINSIITGKGDITINGAGGGYATFGSNGNGDTNINSYVGTTTVMNGSRLRTDGGGGSFNDYGSPGYLGLGLDGTNGVSLANSSNNAASLVLEGGILQASQIPSSSTNRLFTIGTGGASLFAGGQAVTRWVFNNTGAVAFTGTTARTLTLTGNGGNSSAQTVNGGESVLIPQLRNSGVRAPLAITKLGNSVWTLANPANSYTGVTTINAGTLRLGADNAIPTAGEGIVMTPTGVNTNSSPMLDLGGFNLTLGSGGLTFNAATNVTSGAYATLGGSGSITGTINVSSTSQVHLSPGSPVGTLTIVSPISVPDNGSSGLDFNLDVPNSAPGEGNNDLIVLNSTASSLGTALTVNFTGGASFLAGGVTGVYHLVQFPVASTQDFTGWTLKGYPPSTYSFSNNGQFIDLQLNTSPEPASIGVLSIGLMGLLARRHRRIETFQVPSA